MGIVRAELQSELENLVIRRVMISLSGTSHCSLTTRICSNIVNSMQTKNALRPCSQVHKLKQCGFYNILVLLRQFGKHAGNLYNSLLPEILKHV